LNGCTVTFSGKNNAVLLRSKDRPGVIAPIINLLAQHKVNIINLNAYCEERGLSGFTVVEFDGVLSPDVVEEISNQPDVYSATFIKVK
jgi:predicted amino acid-binding ACT domain protein